MWSEYRKYFLSGIGIVLLIFIIGYFSEVVSYVLISWVISMVGDPIQKFLLFRFKLLKFKFGKSLAALITLFVVFAALGSILWFFVPVVIQQAVILSKVDFNSISLALQEPIEKFNTWLRTLGLEPGPSAAEQLKTLVGNYFDPARLSGFFGNLLNQAGHLVIGVFSIVFISFFFLKERNLFKQAVISAVPTRSVKKVRIVIEEVSNLLTRYFGGIIIQMIILIILITGGLAMLGLSNALLIAVFYAIINIIPYVGPLIGAAFGCLLTISSNLELSFYDQILPLLVNVLIVFGIVKLLDDFIIQPFIFSKRVQAHPLEIFLVIMIGARINGILGMVLAIPTYTIFRVIAKEFLSEFKLIRKMTGDLEGKEE
ncbi:MAG: AI-2E family transporter [Saprospiraceae bacterium]|nr:AI-2E family transporter [Saprospiraceae bacterium]